MVETTEVQPVGGKEGGLEVVPVVVGVGGMERGVKEEREPPPPADWVLKSEVDGRDGRVEIGVGR